MSEYLFMALIALFVPGVSLGIAATVIGVVLCFMRIGMPAARGLRRRVAR